jgi:hypothetical protein
MSRRDLTAETAADKSDIEAEARARGIDAYKVRAANAVGDQLVRDIVADAYRGISQSASMIPPSREPAKPKGTGWQDAAPIATPPGVNHLDAIAESFARAERAAAIRQRIENDWIESHFDRGPRIESKYNPFDNSRLKE